MCPLSPIGPASTEVGKGAEEPHGLASALASLSAGVGGGVRAGSMAADRGQGTGREKRWGGAAVQGPGTRAREKRAGTGDRAR